MKYAYVTPQLETIVFQGEEILAISGNETPTIPFPEGGGSQVGDLTPVIPFR